MFNNNQKINYFDEVFGAKPKQNWKGKVKAKMTKVKNWCSENKELIIVVAPVCISAITTIVKVGGRRINLRKTKQLKELYCYDPSLGHYWALKRPLKNSDWVKINNRRNRGEQLGTILEDLKVLR